MKLRVRVKSEVRPRAECLGVASSVELGEGATLQELKSVIMPSTSNDQLELALGTARLVAPDGQEEGATTLASLGVVHNDIVWVTSLPEAVPMSIETSVSASAAASTPLTSSEVRAAVFAAMESIGFERVDAGRDGNVGNDGNDGNVCGSDCTATYRLYMEDDPGNEVAVSLTTSCMASSCMLVGEVSDRPAPAIARLVRFGRGRGGGGGDDDDDDDGNRNNLYKRVTDVFCVPLLQASCRALGVSCPVETLASLPRELIELIMDFVPDDDGDGDDAKGCRTLWSLGMTCRRLAGIVFQRDGVYARRRQALKRARDEPLRSAGRARNHHPYPLSSFPYGRPYPRPGVGGGMGRHIVGGEYDVMPGGLVGSGVPGLGLGLGLGLGGPVLPSRGPSRSSQQWRLG